MYTIEASEFITGCCTMRPLKRFGIVSSDLTVTSPRGSTIGHYNAVRNSFTPVSNWPITFSNSLIDECGLRQQYERTIQP
jgi:hypothetical protein